MGHHRARAFVLVGAVVGVVLLVATVAGAAPEVADITTSNNYKIVTVTFSEAPTVTGGGSVEAADVAVDGATPSLSAINLVDETLTLNFSGTAPVSGVLSFPGLDGVAATTPIPVADGDWDDIDDALRTEVFLPTQEVPIANFLQAADSGGARALDELLPTTMDSSLDLPTWLAIARNGDGSFTLTADGTTFTPTRTLPATVFVDEPFDVDLESSADAPLSVGITGTIQVSAALAVTSAPLTIDLQVTSFSTTLTGAVGILQATADAQLDLDVAVGFSGVDGAVSTTSVTTASALISQITVAGMGGSGTDLVIGDGTEIDTIVWPSLPTNTASARTETAEVDDTSNDTWATAGLYNAANVTLGEVLGAPGALANWIGETQTRGELDVPMPTVGHTLGESVAVAERLAVSHNLVASAYGLTNDPLLAPDPKPAVPNLDSNLCVNLRPFGLRAAEIEVAIAQIIAADDTRDFSTNPITDAEIAAELANVTIDETAAQDAFEVECDYLWSGASVQLTGSAPAVTSAVAIPAQTQTVTEAVELNLSVDELNIGSLAAEFESGTLTRSATPVVAFPFGVKLVSDADLFATHALGMDIDEPANGYTVDDITAAFRIYVPQNTTLGSSSVSLTTGPITGSAEVGFLDVAVTGSASITPSVTMSLTADPTTGLDDGNLDLVELLDAIALDYEADEAADVVSNLDTVFDVGLGTADVDASFTFSSGVLDTTPTLTYLGDLAAYVDDAATVTQNGTVDITYTSNSDSLTITQTFGDAIELSEITPLEAVALVADLLETLAENAAAGSADTRIPVIDVSFDEIAAFTSGLSDAADVILETAPTTISELETFVNDALDDNGLGLVTVSFDVSGSAPELAIELNTDYSASAEYPISFDLSDAGEVFNIVPVDGGATLAAGVDIEFSPEIGVIFDDTLSYQESLFVRDVVLDVTATIDGSIEGSIAVGPVEAFLEGAATMSGTFNASLLESTSSSTTITLADIAAGDLTVDVSGAVPVFATLGLEVPTFAGSITGDVTVESQDLLTAAPTFTTDLNFPNLSEWLAQQKPNLRTLATGVTETSRFLARSTETVGALTGEIPAVGDDIEAQFLTVTDILDEVADTVEATVEAIDDDDDPKVALEADINTALSSVCPAPITCTVTITYIDDEGTVDSFLDATGVEILLDVSVETTVATSAAANMGLEPFVELDLDLSGAAITIGTQASIGLGVDLQQGFYLFPGIDRGEELGTLFELYASADVTLDTLSISLAGVTASADGTELTVSGSLQDGTAAGLKVEMPETLLLSELVNRQRSFSDTFTTSVDGTVEASLPVAFEIDLGGNPLALNLPFEFVGTLVDNELDIELAIVDATFDAGELANLAADALSAIEPYNPLNIGPIDDALSTEVPLLGENDDGSVITVGDIIEQLCGAAIQVGVASGPCTAYLILANIQQVTDEVRELAEDPEGIPLGSFQILPAPPSGQGRYTPPGETEPRDPDDVDTSDDSVVDPVLEDTPAATLLDKIKEFTRDYVTLPILSDVPAMMSIVLGGDLGEDVDIIRFEIPAEAPIIVGKSFALKKELASIDTDFLEGELTVALNGGVGLTIAGGFGYSTRGISNGDFLDGIFLIDNEANEIAIGASLSASVDGKFAVSFGDLDLASVKFSGSGSFSATGGLDLFDESPVLVGRGGGDGRLFLDEIGTISEAYINPFTGNVDAGSFVCMFQIRTSATWSLAFSGKAKLLGVTVFNESWSDGGTLWDETITCELQTRIARVEDRQLILHAGPNAGDRFDGLGDISEGFHLTVSGSNVVVNWDGDTGNADQLTFALSSFDSIVADMGAGSDTLTVASTLNKPITARGGPGADNLQGGMAADNIRGGGGAISGTDLADTIDGQGGNDRIRGGLGDDTITGGPGNDDINGGLGGDDYLFDDAFGTDVLDDTDDSGIDEIKMNDVDTALVGTTAFGETQITTAGGELRYPTFTIERVHGGTTADTFGFKNQEPDGFVYDGRGGGDTTTVQTGTLDRTIHITDSVSGGTDTLNVLGTTGGDVFLMRAESDQLGLTATDGFVARLASSGKVDRYDYDDSIDALVVDGGFGDDEFTSDDNATHTTLEGGFGEDIFQVGQIYGLADCSNGIPEATCTGIASARNNVVGVDPADEFATTSITRGHLSNGVTHELVINAGDNADNITIFANKAEVTANGGDGNDRFVARAFIIAASVTLNGEGNIDDFDYVPNDLITIDGGAGVDSVVPVGTEADDGFVIDVDVDGNVTIDICPIVNGLPDPTGACAIALEVTNVEIFSPIGLEGDDIFWVKATISTALVEISGGDHSDLILMGDGTLDAIEGPVSLSGSELTAVPAIADPVVLPGEDDSPAFDPSATGGTDRGDELRIDASAATDDLDGTFTDITVNGLGMGTAPFDIGSGEGSITVSNAISYLDLDFITTDTGTGAETINVSSIHLGRDTCNSDGCPFLLRTGEGADSVDVEEILGETTIELGAGDDIVTVGKPVAMGTGDSVDDIDAGLIVDGGADADTLDIDDTNDGPSQLDIDPGLITEAGLDADGISHTLVETVHARTGPFGDVVNVRGTAADATTATHVHAGAGNDDVYVSSAATATSQSGISELTGDLDDVQGPLQIHAEAGNTNLLYISDADAAVGNSAVTYDGATLSGMAPADISHDVVGAYGGGITVWGSAFDDTMTITGSDLSTVSGVRTLTTFNTGDGIDTLTVSVADGADGPLVINGEEGGDVLDASLSTLDLIVFGGEGGDDLTTGSGDDLIFGDLGQAATADGGTVTGNGGTGDQTDGGTQALDVLTSDASAGAADMVEAGGGDDIVIGGTADDTIGGGDDDDILVGGHLAAGGADDGDAIDGDAGDDLIAGDNAAVTPSGTSVLRLHDRATTTTAADADAGGPDTVNGGDDDDQIFGQQDNDILNGDAGEDVIEGNADDDTITGGDDQDDLIGGGSALDGVIDDDRSWVVSGLALADGNDTIDGGGDADVALGDNGWIIRTGDTLADIFGTQNAAFDDVQIRTVNQSTDIDPDGSFGADLLRGGDGPDELYGQLDTSRTTLGGNVIEGDELYGDAGADVLIGDLGAVMTILEDGSNAASLASNDPFLRADVRAQGTLTRVVTLFLQQDGDQVDDGDRSDATQFGAEGDDVLVGGDHDDVIHGGGGDDVANGGAGADVAFGGDGADALWGGPDDDQLFGGHDEDAHDVRPRDFTTGTLGPDPDVWFEVAPSVDALAGRDFAYGGWNTDELMADQKVNGPRPGDRLLDWAGAYNRYLSCTGAGGAGTFLREISPSALDFVRQLAEARGAIDATIDATSGYREIGLVEIADIDQNAGNAAGTAHVNCS